MGPRRLEIELAPECTPLFEEQRRKSDLVSDLICWC
jgi:hypothetical protein